MCVESGDDCRMVCDRRLPVHSEFLRIAAWSPKMLLGQVNKQLRLHDATVQRSRYELRIPHEGIFAGSGSAADVIRE